MWPLNFSKGPYYGNGGLISAVHDFLKQYFPCMPYILGIVMAATFINPSIVDLYYIVRQRVQISVFGLLDGVMQFRQFAYK
jgi:hypothetical protein